MIKLVKYNFTITLREGYRVRLPDGHFANVENDDKDNLVFVVTNHEKEGKVERKVYDAQEYMSESLPVILTKEI